MVSLVSPSPWLGYSCFKLQIYLILDPDEFFSRTIFSRCCRPHSFAKKTSHFECILKYYSHNENIYWKVYAFVMNDAPDMTLALPNKPLSCILNARWSFFNCDFSLLFINLNTIHKDITGNLSTLTYKTSLLRFYYLLNQSFVFFSKFYSFWSIFCVLLKYLLF